METQYNFNLAMMTLFAQVPKVIYYRHRSYCNQIPSTFKDEAEENAYMLKYPLRQKLCSENAKMGLSYLTFLATLPAFKFHESTRNLMWLFDVPDYDELSNDQL